jgi:hypothetical protein
LKIGDGNKFPSGPYALKATFDNLRAFFQENPTCVMLELSRPDHTDFGGLPLMPTPSTVGPYERLRRVINVLDPAEPSRKRGRHGEYFNLSVGAGNTVELGISCLKVAFSFDCLPCGACACRSRMGCIVKDAASESTIDLSHAPLLPTRPSSLPPPSSIPSSAARSCRTGRSSAPTPTAASP